MKHHVKKWVPAAALLLLLAGPARAQDRAATVNLQKLFDNYWKTGLLNAALKAKSDDFEKTDRQMTADCDKAKADYQQLLAAAADPALSPEEHQKREQVAENKLQEIRASEDNLAEFERQADATLADQEARMRQDTLADITRAVADQAKAAGYSLVIDSTAGCNLGDSGQSPFVLYSGSTNDITQKVLSELNAGAPVDLTKKQETAPAPERVE